MAFCTQSPPTDRVTFAMPWHLPSIGVQALFICGFFFSCMIPPSCIDIRGVPFPCTIRSIIGEEDGTLWFYQELLRLRDGLCRFMNSTTWDRCMEGPPSATDKVTCSTCLDQRKRLESFSKSPFFLFVDCSFLFRGILT